MPSTFDFCDWAIVAIMAFYALGCGIGLWLLHVELRDGNDLTLPSTWGDNEDV